MASNNHKKCTIQKHPKMLKDFLQENTTPTNYDPTIQVFLDQAKVPRSLSPSFTTFSSFRRRLNTAVKSLHRSTTSSSPALLSRSLSRSLLDKFSVTSRNKSKSKSSSSERVVSNKVKVKDILKWRSFRDLVVEDPSKSFDSLHEYNNNAVFQDNIITTVDSSNDESHFESESESESELNWKNTLEVSLGESEFCYTTMDELPCWWGNLFEARKIWDYNNDVVATVCEIGPKEDDHSVPIEDEKEQHSPISVLDSPFGDEISDQEFESSFDKSFANMERTKQSLLQSIQWLESLAGVSDNEDDETIDLSQEVEQEGNRIGAKTKANRSRAIVKLKREGKCLKYKEMCIKDMEKWSKFEDEKSELVVELEIQLLNDLMSEILDGREDAKN